MRCGLLTQTSDAGERIKKQKKSDRGKWASEFYDLNQTSIYQSFARRIGIFMIIIAWLREMFASGGFDDVETLLRMNQWKIYDDADRAFYNYFLCRKHC